MKVEQQSNCPLCCFGWRDERCGRSRRGQLHTLIEHRPYSKVTLVPYFLRSLSMLSGIVASMRAVDAWITPEIPGDGTVHMDIEGQYIHGEKRSGETSEGGDIRQGEHMKK